jgi:hypothetical protein
LSVIPASLALTFASRAATVSARVPISFPVRPAPGP